MVGGFAIAIYHYKREPTDFAMSCLMILSVIYFTGAMWFAPLYEFSFVQCALACCFLPLRRTWLFPLIYGTGVVIIFANYQAQSAIGWTLPPVDQRDFYFIVLITFILTALIQKFVINSYRKERERLMRYGILGRETTRLTHDIKGLLSSPLMLVESLKNDAKAIEPKDWEKQIHLLADDMIHVREAIRSINSLVKTGNEQAEVDLAKVISGVLDVFRRRSSGVRIQLPESRLVKADPDRMHSVFFNLILNALEHFELAKIKEPFIKMYWQDQTLILENNSPSLGISKAHGSGIGLELAQMDLALVNAKLKMNFSNAGTKTEIFFPSATKI